MRVKEVFNNGELAHLWVHQKYAVGRNSSNSMSFRGKNFYSYNTVIAELVEVPEISELAEQQYGNPGYYDRYKPKVTNRFVVVIAHNTLSKTTVGHVNGVRGAIPAEHNGVESQIVYGYASMNQSCFNHSGSVSYFEEMMEESIEKLKRARVEWWPGISPALKLHSYVTHLGLGRDSLSRDLSLRMYDAADAFIGKQVADIDAANLEALKILGIEKEYEAFQNRKQAKERLKEILFNPEHPEYNVLLSRQKGAAEKRKAQELKLQRNKVERWMGGEWLKDFWETERKLGSVLLRLIQDGDEAVVETSRGVRLNEIDCRLAAKKVMLCRSKKIGWRKNGEQIILKGPHSSWGIDSITSDGGVIAGCHRIKWFAIEKFLLHYGWATQEDIDQVNEQHLS